MATIRLIPSTNAVSNTSYVSVSNASNMYANTDSTTSGTFTHNRASTNNTYYAYLRGFNFEDVPLNATVNSFTVKIKANATGHTTSTSSSYYMSLANGTTQIGSTNASGRLSTTTTTFTFSNGSLTWSQVAEYGANFSIRIPLRRASTNTADVVYVYGAEIEVDYTIPVYHSVNITNNSSTTTVSPSTTQTALEGGSQEITIITSDLNNISVLDNNVDVTSHLVLSQQSNSSTFHLASLDEATGTIYSGSSFDNAIGQPSTNPATDVSGYTRMSVPDNNSLVYMRYNFDCSSIPQNATISSVSCTATVRTGSSSGLSKCQLYSGNTAKGSVYSLTGTSQTTIQLDCGTWTRAELDNAKFYFEGQNSSSTSIRIWGVDLVVEYTISGANVYTYTISNITSDHTIIIQDKSGVYLKVGGEYVRAKVYKKISNSWVEQTAPEDVFNQNTIYIKN